MQRAKAGAPVHTSAKTSISHLRSQDTEPTWGLSSQCSWMKPPWTRGLAALQAWACHGQSTGEVLVSPIKLFIKKKKTALTGVAQWVEHCPQN